VHMIRNRGNSVAPEEMNMCASAKKPRLFEG
jgi:hypothetical protein